MASAYILQNVKTQLGRWFKAAQQKQIPEQLFQHEFTVIIDLYMQTFATLHERVLSLFELVNFIHINAELLSGSNKTFINHFIQNMEDRELEKWQERIVAAPSDEEHWRAFMKLLDNVRINSTDLVIADMIVKKKDVFTLRAAFLGYFQTGNVNALVEMFDQLAIVYQNRGVFEELCAIAAAGLSKAQKDRINIIIAHMFRMMGESANKILFKQYASV
jgi:hypothetical protein